VDLDVVIEAKDAERERERERLMSTETQAGLKVSSDINEFFKRDLLNFPLTIKKEEKGERNSVHTLKLHRAVTFLLVVSPVSFALAARVLCKTLSVFFANSDGLNPTGDVIYYCQYDVCLVTRTQVSCRSLDEIRRHHRKTRPCSFVHHNEGAKKERYCCPRKKSKLCKQKNINKFSF